MTPKMNLKTAVKSPKIAFQDQCLVGAGGFGKMTPKMSQKRRSNRENDIFAATPCHFIFTQTFLIFFNLRFFVFRAIGCPVSGDICTCQRPPDRHLGSQYEYLLAPP